MGGGIHIYKKKKKYFFPYHYECHLLRSILLKMKTARKKRNNLFFFCCIKTWHILRRDNRREGDVWQVIGHSGGLFFIFIHKQIFTLIIYTYFYQGIHVPVNMCFTYLFVLLIKHVN